MDYYYRFVLLERFKSQTYPYGAWFIRIIDRLTDKIVFV